MKKSIIHIFYTKYGLLVLAALLFFLSFVFNTYYSNKSVVSREKKLLQHYIREQQKDFQKVLSDSDLIRKLVQKKETLDEFKYVEAKKYGIYLLAESFFGDFDLLFWNDQLIVPDDHQNQLDDGEYFQHLTNGYYFVIKKTIALSGMSNKLLAYAMIPVQSKYFIETDYLPSEFAYSKNASQRVVIAGKVTDYPIQSESGKILFYLDRKVAPAITNNDTLTIGLRFAALILLVIFIHLLADSTVRKRNAWKGVGLLVGFVITLRLIIYLFPGIFNFRQFELFDPTIYGSSRINSSLGDLLINSVLFCWVSLFAWIKLAHEKINFMKYPEKLRWAIGMALLFVLILFTFTVSITIRSLVADSKISFDVTNFFSLNKYSVVGFFVLACLSLGFY